MLGLDEELNDKFKDLKERIEPLQSTLDQVQRLFSIIRRLNLVN